MRKKVVLFWLSSYTQLTFKDGESEKELVIPIAQKPQEDDVTVIDVNLLTPTAGTLGDVTTTRVTIKNDVGECVRQRNVRDVKRLWYSVKIKTENFIFWW